ncbi:glycosyltransferase family 2 protein [uncultured Dokdonia sp.]|uniref:glycosyltransferase family A protein n=1 Tax=uncultured Dokdonia sp. TaxID=575653 RepID=UPI002605001E|nr:glycosyltransferase family 2 protein [uncultured Dokdonia sp.]
MKPVSVPFEILISTMFRSDLSFLEAMFPNGDYSMYAILIINQTDTTRQLQSLQPNVRVINTEERGLPQSRNMAIRNAIGEVCLVADDDVLYVPNLESIILQGYKTYPDAVVITFQLNKTNGELFRKYPDVIKHNNSSYKTVNGVVISFKKDVLLENDVLYHPHFGLGATFSGANEYVFMRNVMKAKLPAYFVPAVILTHPDVSSGQDLGSDRLLYLRGALAYKCYGIWGYLWVCKYVFFLVRHQIIKAKYAFAKAKKAFSGIKKYKELLATGEERK